MSKYWVEYVKEYRPSPASLVVHRPLDCEHWSGATKFDPPLPQPEVGKGYPVSKVEAKGYELSFSSMEEVEHCIDVLSQKNLPTTRSLAEESWLGQGYQHLHWLTKLPSALKSYKERQKIVRLLGHLKSHNQ
ncbi:hypothetical protein [Marinobacter zhejiangensis]|uniref:Uncharacterized protein n=1 Tax=Marinobacter zhejiangensis TaxID=488535 RepID=A0A1I4T3P8_9GAMM|nr:hypothetical protein [Marinobacter zhejiangensis]SFM71342.1 hypothetical protein SAMN04487963_3479 [Marinobacter zhejiangensis]